MQPQTRPYKTVQGVALQADVYRAEGAGPGPVLVWLHGGALISGHRGEILPSHLRGYLEAGYTVVSPDYRLAPETKLPEIATDLCEVFAWVRAEGPRQFGADPARVAAVGHSAGGYLTLLAGALVRPRLQALVAWYGYGDIIGDWYRFPDRYYRQRPLVTEAEARAAVGAAAGFAHAEGEVRGRFYLYCRQQGRWPQEVAGFDPEREPEAFTPFCPVRQVTADYPPTLLLHGTADTDVPYAQSVQMAEELTRHRVPHELITVARGEHGFDYQEDPRAVSAFAQVVAFLRARL